MGLDASVMCTCWRQGLATPPPFPEFIHFEDGFVRADPSLEKDPQKLKAMQDWIAHCCDHPDMKRADVRIGNYASCRFLYQKLVEVGKAHFQVLCSVLPHGSAETTSAAKAAEGLDEIHFFRTGADLGTNLALVDAQSGEVVTPFVEDFGGEISLMKKSEFRMAFGDDGFVITRSSDSAAVPLFRAMQFRQTILHTDSRGLPTRVLFTDEESGRDFECTDAASAKHLRMRVERRSAGASEYSHALDALFEVFSASIQTGNPVVWE